MLGQAFATNGRRYNVIILAGGAGSRMGEASEYIPKALTKFGTQRAIDRIINRYSLIADKFIVGVGHHADLLTNYIQGHYGKCPIEFSTEKVEDIKNNAISTMLCLDHADSRLGTIITFCDLLILSNYEIKGSTIYIATKDTEGHPGLFRHSIEKYRIVQNEGPSSLDDVTNGILGTFVLNNTTLLKEIAYREGFTAEDLTIDIIEPYSIAEAMAIEKCKKVYEFGTEKDLKQVREMWAK